MGFENNLYQKEYLGDKKTLGTIVYYVNRNFCYPYKSDH